MPEAPVDVPLEALILTVLRELPSGDVVRVPVADPKLASIGSRSSTHAELVTFLAEHLATIPPSALARFVSPPGATLISVEVTIEREDLPRRLAIDVPTLFRAVVVPVGKARWVFVPVLGHVAYVDEKEDLEATLKAEIIRLVSASEPTPLSWLALLPAPAESLDILPVPIERRERAPGGRAAALHKQLANAAKTRDALAVLESIGLALDAKTEAARSMKWVAREAELATLTALLGSKSKQSVLVVGRERVGKSALILAWLQAEKRAGRTRLAFVTSGAQLIAGMSGLGQWQERLKRTLQAAEVLDAVLVFDDIGDLFGDKGAGAIDLAGTMRPWLQEGRVRVVAEVSPEALHLFEPRDVGFFGCFARVRLEPLDVVSSRLALEARTHGEVSPEAINTIIELAERYLPYRPLPGKVIQLFEEVAARADDLRDAQGEPRKMDPEDVLEAFSQSSGIPVFLLREDRALYREQVTAIFRQRLIGQDEAIRRVIDTICVVKAGLQPTGKPLATFLFVGPTGVGKTELARTLAEFLFGTSERLVRFDMSEYADPLAAERLFRGGSNAEGLLTRQIRQQPFSVLLLDEIEKAHSGVFDLLLQVTGEGRLTDARGRTAYFHNSIVIMTSNLGAAHRRPSVGIGRDLVSDDGYYLKEVERAFRPELVNRLDRVITFEPLTAGQVEQVSRIAVRKLGARRGFSAARIALDTSEPAMATLSKRGYSAEYGARALRRELEDRLVAPAARLLASMAPEPGRGGRLAVTTIEETVVRAAGQSLEHEGLRFQITTGPRGVKSDARGAATEISELRVEATRALALERVEHVKESIETLVAQLARASKARDPKRGADAAMLQRDHHRLSELWADADQPYQDLLAAEELGLSAYLSHHEPGDSATVARTAIDAFRRALALVLLAEEPSPNHVMVRVKEIDDGRSLAVWLAAFAAGAEARGWTVRGHIDGDRRSDWPEQRHFGPPRTIAEVQERLALRVAGWSEVLLAVEGPWAGPLFGLEMGIHRFSGRGGRTDPTHLSVRAYPGRTEFTDKEWITLFPYEVPDGKTDHAKRPAVRELDARRDTLRFADTSIPSRRDLSTYWRDLELVAYWILTHSTRSAREADAP